MKVEKMKYAKSKESYLETYGMDDLSFTLCTNSYIPLAIICVLISMKRNSYLSAV